MKPLQFNQCIVVLLATVGGLTALPFAEKALPPGPPPPDEIQAPARPLSPAELQARLQQTREARGGALPLPDGADEEYAVKRREVRDRFQKQLAALRQKKNSGALPAADQRHLERMEELARHFERAAGITNRLFHFDPSRRNEALRRMAELRQKQADATITDEEKRQLERMEEMARRFEQAGSSPGRPPGEPRRKDEIQRRLTDLREKKTAGTITDQEQRQLTRMEEIEKRIREGGPPPFQRPGEPE